MLQELTSNTGAALLAIGSTLFFFFIFMGVALRVITRKRGSYDAAARLPLEDAPAAGAGAGTRESRTRGH